MDLSLESLPANTLCHVSKSCTSINCCVREDLLDSTVQFKLGIDACNFLLDVGIERLQTIIDLIGYKWGKYGSKIFVIDPIARKYS